MYMVKPQSNSPQDRDGSLISPWQSAGSDWEVSAPFDLRPVDVLIIGAGITGLTTALLLQKAGKRTLVVDAWHAGFGTTGGTSAHINSFADTTYAEVENAFGIKGSALFADAVRQGAELIGRMVAEYGIDCQYASKSGYLYAEDEAQCIQLNNIYEAALRVGVPVAYVDRVPTPVPFKKSLCWPDQAQFHPLNYIKGLHQAYLQAGGFVQENTLVTAVEKDGDRLIALAGEKRFTASAVVYATHMPPNINLFNFECAPYRSYMLAVKLKGGKYPDALIYDSQEPYHYVRTQEIDGEELLLVGGLDHKTGHDDPENAFQELEKYVRTFYSVSSVKYRWSSQYYVPVDGLPYIGKMPLAPNHIYCATGFNGNGMMLGSVAAHVLADLITGKPNPYAELFDPGRVKPVDSFQEFVKENADVAYHFIADRFGFKESESFKQLKPGSGKLLSVDGERVAAYRDEQGHLFTLRPVCTHAGCIVQWNGEEKSWDCPCHGARYDIEGRVITGPATAPLQSINY